MTRGKPKHLEDVDEQWLYEHYVEKGMTQQEIADQLLCSQAVVSEWVADSDIETLGPEPRPSD